MPDGLYDRDMLLWSETQAGLLRRLAAGERVNDAVDWANLIEEVEDMGRSELHSCESLLLQALIHLLKAKAWPDSLAVPHWRAEAVAFLVRAGRRFAPSMRQKIDVDGLYADALRVARLETDDSGQPAVLPDANPFTLDHLLDPNGTAVWPA